MKPGDSFVIWCNLILLTAVAIRVFNWWVLALQLLIFAIGWLLNLGDAHHRRNLAYEAMVKRMREAMKQ